MGTATESISLGNAQFSHAQIASTLTPKIQQLILLPTEKCNFRCSYCYEDFKIGKMKEAVIVGIERYMDRRIPELSKLSLSWFGGEPLIARDAVLRISAHASRLCKDYGVALEGGLTTNAYILDFDLFEELLSYDQRFFQITLDGWREGHDAVRRRAKGRPTFDRIWENLLATRGSRENFHIMIRVHVRRDNRSSLEALLDNIASAFGGDARYTLDFEHLRNLGGEGGKSVDRPLTWAELREVELELRSRYESAAAKVPGKDMIPSSERGGASISAAPLGEVSGTGSGTAPYICYAAKPNSLLVRADGRIGKCTVALTDDRNTIGHLNEDGTLTLDNNQLQPWIRGLHNLNPEALACPLAGMSHTAAAAGAA
jgi:uncharacterized protein